MHTLHCLIVPTESVTTLIWPSQTARFCSSSLSSWSWCVDIPGGIEFHHTIRSVAVLFLFWRLITYELRLKGRVGLSNQIHGSQSKGQSIRIPTGLPVPFSSSSLSRCGNILFLVETWLYGSDRRNVVMLLNTEADPHTVLDTTGTFICPQLSVRQLLRYPLNTYDARISQPVKLV